MLKAPASERNKEHILKVLTEHVSTETSGDALEIASGPGTHAALFAQHYKNISWQPSDIEPRSINSISEYKKHFNLSNIKEPLRIDITTPIGEWKGNFPEKSLEIMVNINMIHISPWATAKGLFKTAGLLLKPGGHLFLYGVGTNLVNVQLQKKQEVTVRELGGSMSPIWPNFFKDAKNIIFLLDLSNRLQVSAACIQLLTTLSHKSLVSSRFLVLLNKVDSVSVMTKTEFESLFRWSEIVKHCKQNVTLLEISALTGHNLDAIIDWLQQNYSSSPS
ncbi:hypothetical protein FSP39_019879 [Pinctada imbricata]|uniref:Methyltransferase-like 26 n=1 Tax=Pinctada imbricata TaxID=66713 RepID=A0AA88XSB7_PINIB|nr:hypothetical protein FSP39_019879 [Pinctada imbricata]